MIYLLSLNGSCDLNLKDLDFNVSIGVDGGTNHLLKAGLKPDIVIGDFDSFSGEVEGAERITYPVEKDEIDAELAIRESFKRGAQIVKITCWRGERADMEYALYLLLTAFPPLSVKLLSRKLEVVYISGKASFSAKVGEKWSILPIGGDAVVTLEGFKYEIFKKNMPHDKPYGVSNIALRDEVVIETKEGGVLVFRWKKEPS